MKNTLAELKAIIQLVNENRIDVLEYNGIKIVKTRHDAREEPLPASPILDEDILFHSSS